MSKLVLELFNDHPLLPVVVLEDARKAVPLARALQEGGVNIMEITMRTDSALEAVERITDSDMGMVTGLGTVLEADHFRYAAQVGARFTSSPGLNIDLVNVSEEEKIAYLPGVFTASEIMLARDEDYHLLKFFPAYSPTGETMYLQFARAFKKMQFVLTGGVNASNFKQAKAMPQVVTVGGTWLAPRELVAAEKWQEITELARHAAGEIKKLSEPEPAAEQAAA